MGKAPIKMATAQSPILADIRQNGREIRRLMHQAHMEGARLVHFPEGAMSGYAKSQIKNWGQVNWPLLEEELGLVADLCRQLGLWVVVGCNHRLTLPNRPHNSLYVINADGKLVTRYDKQFCSHNEITHWYSPGSSYCVFEIEGWRFGCVICIEIQFAELFLAYAQLEVDCVLFSSNADVLMFGTQAQGYAASHNYWISVSVPSQTSQALSSRLIGPSGAVQTVATPCQSTVVIGELDLYAPQWAIPLHHARPWRITAREGSIYRQRDVRQDPRSEEKARF